MRKRLFYLFDLLIVSLSPFVAVVLRNNFAPSNQQLVEIIPFAALGVCVAAVVFVIAGIHKSIWRYVSLPDLSGIIVATAATLLITLFVTFSVNRLDNIARSIPLIQWVLIVAGMVLARVFARALFMRHSTNAVRWGSTNRQYVLIVGLNHVAELYLRCVAALASNKVSVAGLLDESVVMKGRRIHGHQVLGQPRELSQVLELLNVHGVDVKRIVITTPFQELSPSSREVLLKLERGNVIELDLFEERLGFSEPAEEDYLERGADTGLTGFVEEFSIKGNQGTENMGYRLIKRGIDIVAALVLIIVFLPITLLVSLLVALDVGLPLTFWQERPGKGGYAFSVFKFRTMNSAHDEFGVRIPDDDRQSKFGCFLRRTRFDELPQLFNILVGDMSFVGPRPLLPVDLPASNPEHIKIRNSIRPGLTGWAQVSGGKTVSVEDKAVLDMWYIQNISLGLDFKIILHTIDMVIRGERYNEVAVDAAYADLGLMRKKTSYGESVK